MNTPMFDALRKYLLETSKEQVFADWEKVRRDDRRGITGHDLVLSIEKRLVNCPMCLFSSGTKAFSGKFGKGQICEDCKGTGVVKFTKYLELRARYGDVLGGAVFAD